MSDTKNKETKGRNKVPRQKDRYRHKYHKYHNNEGENWKIATINIRGLKDGIKPRQITEHMEEQGIQILGLSETNLTEEEHRHVIADHPKFRSYWANGEKRGEGVGVLIERNLDRHNIKVRRYGGRIITIELLFKDKVKMGIAQIYLPSDKDRRYQVEESLKKIVQSWESSNSHIIVMGDFNAVEKPRKDRKGHRTNKAESKIFRFMKEYDLQDSFRTYNKEQVDYTWEERDLGSRIDMIWTSGFITEHTQDSSIIDIREELNTDHKQPRIQVDATILGREKVTIRDQRKMGPYNTKEATKEVWKKWEEDLEEKIGSSTEGAMESVDLIWDRLAAAMKAASEKHFRRIRIKGNISRGKGNHRPTPLYAQYKKLNSLIGLTEKYQKKQEGTEEATREAARIERSLEEIWRGMDQDLLPIANPVQHISLATWRETAKYLRNATRNSLKLEQKQINRSKITERIEARILKFKN
jgi:exonuclease III